MKLLVGVPILTPSFEFFVSWTNLWEELIKSNIEVAYSFTYRQPGHIAQDKFAKLAVANDCTHLLLMDDDVYDVSLKDVFSLKNRNVDVVGGAMFSSLNGTNLCAKRKIDPCSNMMEYADKKSEPFSMYAVPEPDWKGLQEVDLLSFGCTLIKTSVFKKLDKSPFWDDSGMLLTDSIFCQRCADKDIKTYVDFDVWLNHRGVTLQTHKLYGRIHQLKTSDENPTIVISKNVQEVHMKLMRQIMEEAQARFAKRKGEEFNVSLKTRLSGDTD